MLQLLGDSAAIDDSFFRELFLQCLPNNVRMVLAASINSTPLDNLAEVADQVMEVAVPTIASVNQPAPLSAPIPTPPLTLQPQAASAIAVEFFKPSSDDYERVLSELAKLQATVKNLTKTYRKRHS